MHDIPCICIDVNGLFVRLGEAAPALLWIFTAFAAFMGTLLFLSGVLLALLDSWVIRHLADYIRGEKRKRKNDER
jgi:hypothetical protein